MGTKFILGQEDGTVAGGSARGEYAVDLQTNRTNANQVAGAEYSNISGGISNRVNAPCSAILGGNNNYIAGSVGSSYQNKIIVGGSDNQISNVATRNTFIGGGYGNNINGSSEGGLIVGGYQNTLSGSQTTIGGGQGNIVSSSHSTISGGQSNTASTNSHATVVGGFTNTTSGQYAISGVRNSTASGLDSIALGRQNTASGASSFATGQNSVSLSSFSESHLWYGYAYLRGQNSYGVGGDNLGILSQSTGRVQYSNLTAYTEKSLTTGGTQGVFLDGNGLSGSNEGLIIPGGNNRMWNVTIDTIAVVTAITGTATGISVGDCYRETKQLLFKRIGGTSSIVGTVDTSAIKSDSGMSTAALTVSAGASQQMALTFTAPTFAGGGSVTCRVVSKVMLVEVAY